MLPNHESSRVNQPQIRKLYYWLSYNRFSVLLYGGLFYLPYFLVLVALIVLAIVFAPYVLYVLYKNGKRGWLVTFAIVVGIPVLPAFLPTGSDTFDAVLRFLPLLAFYFYCYMLRFSVGDWLSDASPLGEIEVDERERQDHMFR